VITASLGRRSALATLLETGRNRPPRFRPWEIVST
jgi:hypothetical protein